MVSASTLHALARIIHRSGQAVGGEGHGPPPNAAVPARTLRPGDHLLSSSYLFGNTNSLFNTFARMGVSVDFVDAKETLVSYCIVDCDSYERAVEIVSRVVAFTGETAEIRPVMDVSLDPEL